MEHTIVIHDNSYSCGGGCCDWLDYRVEVDGSMLQSEGEDIKFMDGDGALAYALKTLGIEVKYGVTNESTTD